MHTHTCGFCLTHTHPFSVVTSVKLASEGELLKIVVSVLFTRQMPFLLANQQHNGLLDDNDVLQFLK